MMHDMRRTVVLPLALAIAVALVPSVAGAATYRHRDASADVYAYTGGPQGTVVPSRTDGDVTWTKVSYRRHALLVTVRAAALDRQVTSWGTSYRIHTSKGPDRHIELTARPGRKTRVNLAKLTSAGLVAVRCHVARRVSYAYDVIRIRVPAHCLGRPRALRVAIGLTGTTSADTYRDDANLTGGSVYDPFVYGPVVRRG